jgi:hypothetical protein
MDIGYQMVQTGVIGDFYTIQDKSYELVQIDITITDGGIQQNWDMKPVDDNADWTGEPYITINPDMYDIKVD